MTSLTERFLGFGRRTTAVGKPAFGRVALWFCACNFFCPTAISQQPPPDLTLANEPSPLTSGTYQATNSITAGPSLTVSGTVNFVAGNFIRLVPGFQATTGSTFRAYIACVYSISPISQSFTSAGGSGSVTVTAAAGCLWTAVSNNTAWLHVTGGASGSGNGVVSYSVDANAGAARNGTITIAGQTFTATQAGSLTITTNSPLPNGIVGTAYSQTLVATGGTPPYSWSVLSGQLPAGVSLSSGGVLSGTPTAASTYNFTVQASGGGTATKALSLSILLPIPTQWKGINYSPRQHSYFRMLYDWYSYNLGPAVDADLQRLKDNGFNLIHLYLWDRRSLIDNNPSEAAGFTDLPGSPNPSGGQWAALDEFVGKAESKGLFVALHFVSYTFNVERQGNAVGAGTQFATWAGEFINHLTPAHTNVLLWGLAYANWPLPGNLADDWSVAWQTAYKLVDGIAKNRSPAAGTLGLIGVNLDMVPLDYDPNHPEVIARPSGGYRWSWDVGAQKMAKTMRDLLSLPEAQGGYGYPKDPDAYLMQLFTANAGDTQNTVVSLTTNTGGDATRLAVPASKIFVVEWATSSAIGNPNGNPSGISVAAIGDSQTPTTTAAGQSQWTANVICAYRNAGINKYAYWAMYDPYTLWSGSPWFLTGQGLAWNGFWGLSTDSGSDKPAWGSLRNFYLTDPSSWSCPSTPIPVVSLLANNDYFTLGQPVRVTWTAADVSSMSLDRGYTKSYSCLSEQELAPTGLTGSCAYTEVTGFSTMGTQTVTLTGFNGSQSATANASASVGFNPLVNAATDQVYSSTINTFDTIIIWGNGFSVTGGNTLQFTRPGYADVWMYTGDGSSYFWNLSYRQINASLDGRLAPGAWTLYVRNGYSGDPSAAFAVTISQ